MIISKVNLQEVRRIIQRQFRIHDSKCYANSVLHQTTVNPENVFVADILPFDREKTFPLYMTGADVFEVDHGYKHCEKGDAVKVERDGKWSVFMPPVVEKFGPYLIIVAGLYAFYGQVDEGFAPHVLVVDNVTRELPPHPYLPERMPQHSYDYQYITMTRRDHGESRHFLSSL